MNALTRTRAEWRKYLLEAHGETVGTMMELCKRLHEYQQSCNGKQGGSDFAETVKDWCGYGKDVARKMAAVGGDDLLRTSGPKLLPESYRTLYEITTLSEEQRKTLPITPNLTRQQVKNFKDHGQLEAPKPEVELEDKIPEAETGLEEAAMLVPPLEEWGLTVLGKRAMNQDRKHLQKALSQIAKSQSRKFVETMIDVMKYHQAVFKRELERQIPDTLKARKKALDERENRLNLREKAMVGGINGESRKLILNVLHPDRAPAGMEDRYTKAFQAFKEVSG